jgi:hypothetical protein
MTEPQVDLPFNDASHPVQNGLSRSGGRDLLRSTLIIKLAPPPRAHRVGPQDGSERRLSGGNRARDIGRLPPMRRSLKSQAVAVFRTTTSLTYRAPRPSHSPPCPLSLWIFWDCRAGIGWLFPGARAQSPALQSKSVDSLPPPNRRPNAHIRPVRAIRPSCHRILHQEAARLTINPK